MTDLGQSTEWYRPVLGREVTAETDAGPGPRGRQVGGADDVQSMKERVAELGVDHSDGQA